MAVMLAVIFLVMLATQRIENLYLLICAKIFLCAGLYMLIMKMTNASVLTEAMEYLKSKMKG